MAFMGADFEVRAPPGPDYQGFPERSA